jgi:hypothetical protein
MQWSVVTWRGASLIRSLPYTLACTAKSASGTAGGFIGRQPVTPATLALPAKVGEVLDIVTESQAGWVSTPSMFTEAIFGTLEAAMARTMLLTTKRSSRQGMYQ